MVAALGKARGVPIEFEAVTPGGYDLSDHWNGGLSLERLRAQRWDVVVLQQGPSALPESQAQLKEWASRWSAEIRDNGARPALYQVWPENYRRSVLPVVIASYRNAASASGALLLPAGQAWSSAWRRNAKLKLYGPDAFHPSAMGTYLAALVVFCGLTEATPVGLPRTLRTTSGEACAVREDGEDPAARGGRGTQRPLRGARGAAAACPGAALRLPRDRPRLDRAGGRRCRPVGGRVRRRRDRRLAPRDRVRRASSAAMKQESGGRRRILCSWQ